jgi:Holliday junction resolvasome RuvABC ATP-dependent DNA helicase subunit
MLVDIIKEKDVLNIDEAQTITGGINELYFEISTRCICDCIIGNKNKENAKDNNSVLEP